MITVPMEYMAAVITLKYEKAILGNLKAFRMLSSALQRLYSICCVKINWASHT